MTVLTKPQESIAPTKDEQQQALETSRFLAPLLSGDIDMQIVDNDGHSAPLSPPVRRLLYEALRQIAAGNAVTLQPLPAEMTTQQAADYLNVSRPYLIKMLIDGQIPFHMTGTHRRVRLEDITTYKSEDDARRHAALDELTALSQEMGLY